MASPHLCLAALGLVLPVASPVAGMSAPNPPDSAAIDYLRWPAGQTYGRAEAARDWPTLRWFDEPGDAHIREFPAGSGRHWLEIGFPADTFGGGRHGCKFAADLAPRDGYTVDYEVHFPTDWEFSRNNAGDHGGGKLPGLSGGSHPSGGHGRPDGMSARPMWRRDDRFSPGRVQNYLELYLYWRGQTETYGDRTFAQIVEPGRTYRLTLRIELGTPETDGTVRLWIDGALRVERSVRFLGPGQSWKLSQYMHNVFYGGNDPTWAPAHDQHLLLGPVRVDTQPF